MAKRKKTKVMPILVIVAVCLIGFFVIKNVGGYQDRPIALTAPVTVEIKQGASSAAISKALYEKGLTHKENDFKNYSKQQKISQDLKPGVYTFTGEVTLEKIAQILVKGQTNELKITIPEGLTVKQTAEKIIVHDYACSRK